MRVLFRKKKVVSDRRVTYLKTSLRPLVVFLVGLELGSAGCNQRIKSTSIARLTDSIDLACPTKRQSSQFHTPFGFGSVGRSALQPVFQTKNHRFWQSILWVLIECLSAFTPHQWPCQLATSNKLSCWLPCPSSTANLCHHGVSSAGCPVGMSPAVVLSGLHISMSVVGTLVISNSWQPRKPNLP